MTAPEVRRAGCTEEEPCKNPILRWVHSKRCRKLTEKPIRKLIEDSARCLRERGDDQLSNVLWKRWEEAVFTEKIRRARFLAVQTGVPCVGCKDGYHGDRPCTAGLETT